jgi:hypothetical protein
MACWEYKVLRFNVSGGKHLRTEEIEVALNELGAEGWECFEALPVEDNAETMCIVYNLRRVAEPKNRMGFQP